MIYGKTYDLSVLLMKTLFLQVEATDSDLGENAIVSYSIFHVSNNGRSKFTIDRDTGLIESIGKLIAGEQYSITVEVRSIVKTSRASKSVSLIKWLSLTT